jgi:hypothetical protein
MNERLRNQEIADRICQDLQWDGQSFRIGDCVALLDEKVIAVTEDLDSALQAFRWVDHTHISEEVYFFPYAEVLLAHLALDTFVLVMDGRAVGRGCVVALMIHVIDSVFRGCAPEGPVLECLLNYLYAVDHRVRYCTVYSS